MLISQLAKATGTTKDTIRHYHQQGLLIVEQRAAGSRFYHDYLDENIERIASIRHGKTMGFTLSEIASLQEAYYSGELLIQDKIEILHEKLLLIEQKIQDLEQIKTSIQNKLSILSNVSSG
jgi:MerR family transcriptional regulator, copper efflux regulator